MLFRTYSEYRVGCMMQAQAGYSHNECQSSVRSRR
ncbi:hypothetical protein SAMN05444364_1501 [Prevotella scopos JCM 17725]|uniref:Uncharacterized protein n=1 Tax=Prevotella scopos JCM 17725 TaxID=1236518 RepID=A0AAX2F7E2_9BACT|nr:hypothetical protein SAMN05444364_1501 [Prevotella scopos JCM 17725]